MFAKITKVGRGHPKLLVVQMPPLAYQTVRYEEFNEPNPIRRSSRTAAKFRAVPEIRGDFARLYIENCKSYEKVSGRGNTVDIRL